MNRQNLINRLVERKMAAGPKNKQWYGCLPCSTPAGKQPAVAAKK